MDRTPAELNEMIATAERAVEEIKETQIFGGDALFLNEFTEQLDNVSSATYQLTLAPASDLGVLPSKLYLKWTNTQIAGQASTNYVVSQVYRDDGVFEWRITGGYISAFDTYIVLQYLGEGTVTLTKVA